MSALHGPYFTTTFWFMCSDSIINRTAFTGTVVAVQAKTYGRPPSPITAWAVLSWQHLLGYLVSELLLIVSTIDIVDRALL